MTATASPELLAQLVIANKILYDHGVVDAMGHISVRHDKNPERYIMSRHLAPALVTEGDLVAFDLDSNPVVDIGKPYYSERFIHGEIYKAQSAVMSVVHCHAPPLIPFGVTKSGKSLKPIYHMSGFLGAGVPVFDIRSTAGMTSMLVRTPILGAALARCIGDKPVVLMRGHGATMVGSSIAQAVYRAVYAAMNASLQMQAQLMGEVEFLAPEEAELAAAQGDSTYHRHWALWEKRLRDQERPR
jgi:ribulose-5-phosphate 4-epimerase/fuculose-1-phosphate aldolase